MKIRVEFVDDDIIEFFSDKQPTVTDNILVTFYPDSGNLLMYVINNLYGWEIEE